MEKNVDWRLKIGALFHDPPHKPWALRRGHEALGQDVARSIVGEDFSPQEWQRIKDADCLASGADRYAWLQNLNVDPQTELEIVHPLEGKPVSVPGSPTGRALELAVDSEALRELDALLKQVPDLVRPISAIQDRFLVLWRFLPDLLRVLEDKREQGGPGKNSLRLGTLWDILPADTRMPDHSVLVHTSLVSAFASLLAQGGQAALLRFAVGPVQDFVSNARKLRDLWAGSSILANTIWRAIEIIVEKYGPDHVLYPSLRFEPRFDRWLLQRLANTLKLDLDKLAEKGEEKPDPLRVVIKRAREHQRVNLRVPSLPNVFVTVVPLEDARSLATRAEQAVRGYWSEEAARVAREKVGASEALQQRAREQAASLLQVFWSIVPWDLSDSARPHEWFEDPKRCWHGTKSPSRKRVTFNDLAQVDLGGYKPNIGFVYSDLNDQAALLVDAAKRERVRHPREENGLKCSVCGELEVLADGDFWEQRATGYGKRGDAKILKHGEQLCGPCTWKRHFESDGIGERHPSTGEIAASAFKRAVVKHIVEHGERSHLWEPVKAFVEAAERAFPENEERVFYAYAIEQLVRGIKEKPTVQDFVERFASIDGQWLLPFPREDLDDAPQERTELLRQVRRAAASLRRVAGEKANMAPPRPYLAVVVFDGDEMGKWVSGEHPRFPRLRGALHSKVLRKILAEHSNLIVGSRELPRPVTPAFHGALSAAAASFARIGAPQTIECEELCGHLVYAGGDDALFLAPVEDAVELVLRLRLRFSGYPRSFSDRSEAARPESWLAASLGDTGRPYPAASPREVDRLGLAFGKLATASAGMCVFHYRWPLSAALHLAHEACETSKKRGRNRLTIVVQRRSGSRSECTLPFGDGSTDSNASDLLPQVVKTNGGWRWGGPIGHLLWLTERFTAGELSPRLASLFRAEVAPLLGPDGSEAGVRTTVARQTLWEVAEKLAVRVCSRRVTEQQNKLGAQARDEVLGLGRALRAAGDKRPVEETIQQWADALTVAAFLGRTSEERGA